MKSQILEIISNSLSMLEKSKEISYKDVKDIISLLYDRIKTNSNSCKGTVSKTITSPDVKNSFAGVHIQR